MAALMKETRNASLHLFDEAEINSIAEDVHPLARGFEDTKEITNTKMRAMGFFEFDDEVVEDDDRLETFSNFSFDADEQEVRVSSKFLSDDDHTSTTDSLTDHLDLGGMDFACSQRGSLEQRLMETGGIDFEFEHAPAHPARGRSPAASKARTMKASSHNMLVNMMERCQKNRAFVRTPSPATPRVRTTNCYTSAEAVPLFWQPTESIDCQVSRTPSPPTPKVRMNVGHGCAMGTISTMDSLRSFLISDDRISTMDSLYGANVTADKVDESETVTGSTDETNDPPSIGSASHTTGDCRPCVWFLRPEGCETGANCSYCHLCEKGAVRKRVVARRKEQAQRRGYVKYQRK